MSLTQKARDFLRIGLATKKYAKEIADAIDLCLTAVGVTIVQTITNGDTTHAPSADVVFDALALKVTTSKLVVYESAVSVGGGVTESMTVTGLLGTDTVLAVTGSVKGANAAAVNAFGAPGAGALSVTFTADPGAGMKVKVFVLKA